MATQCLWFCVVLSYSESFSLGQAIFFSIVFFFFVLMLLCGWVELMLCQELILYVVGSHCLCVCGHNIITIFV